MPKRKPKPKPKPFPNIHALLTKQGHTMTACKLCVRDEELLRWLRHHLELGYCITLSY